MHTTSIQAEVPPIDGCCEKEIFAFFGLVAYTAQVLEHSALNLAIVLRLPAVNQITKQDFNKLYQQLTRKTFGGLISAARGLIQVSEEKEEILKSAVDLRNYITHHYFRDRAEDFVSLSGQHEMKREMQQFVARFTEADRVLTSLYQPLWDKYGVTEDYIQAQMEELAKQAKERDQNPK